MKGVLLSVSEPETLKSSGMKVQHCVMQHEFNQEKRYNKYVVFDVLGDNIERMGLRPQEDVEIAMDVNARMASGGRWFNSLTGYGVERDKSKWHHYQDNRQRVAVMPDGTAGQTHPQGPPLYGGENGTAETDAFDGDPYSGMP